MTLDSSSVHYAVHASVENCWCKDTALSNSSTNKDKARQAPTMLCNTFYFNSSIYFSRSDELYNFFQLWAPDIYGELQEEEIFSKGFILVEEDTELWDEEEHEEGEIGDSIGGELKDMTKESWEKIKAPYVKIYSLMKSQMTISTESENPEVVSMSEELRRALYSSGSLTSLDLEVFLPDVNGTTEIITDHVRKGFEPPPPLQRISQDGHTH
ncbi:uncharacterized protein [Penaeus vannamei]|uniref:uncharacterized protein n=1 Tax=Penaeus vannamei TaxID=6689 RepID=UPI00387F3F4D